MITKPIYSIATLHQPLWDEVGIGSIRINTSYNTAPSTFTAGQRFTSNGPSTKYNLYTFIQGYRQVGDSTTLKKYINPFNGKTLSSDPESTVNLKCFIKKLNYPGLPDYASNYANGLYLNDNKGQRCDQEFDDGVAQIGIGDNSYGYYCTELIRVNNNVVQDGLGYVLIKTVGSASDYGQVPKPSNPYNDRTGILVSGDLYNGNPFQ